MRIKSGPIGAVESAGRCCHDRDNMEAWMLANNKIPDFISVGPAARAAYEENGAVILRQALPTAMLEYAQMTWPAAFALFDAKSADRARGELPPGAPFSLEVDMFTRLQFIQHQVLGIMLSVFDMRPQRVADAVGSLISPMFEEGVSFVEDKSAIRRQGRQSAYVPWHRDAHAVQLKELGTCVNCWVPIHSVGRDRPSVQVVCGSHLALRDRPVDYAVHDNPTDEEVDRDYPGRAQVAMLEPGDMLILGHHTLHRTQPMADHAGRISAEFRFTIKSR
jgi:hypothetical protein